MPVTYKTHYNPCFWTAYWNEEYLNQIENAQSATKHFTAREQKVYCLKPQTNRAFIQKTDKIFYEEGTGLSYMDDEEILDFTKRNFPDQYEGILKYLADNGDGIFMLDFENVFTGLENLVKDYLTKVNVDKVIATTEEKTHLSMFIFLQHMRNPTVINPMIQSFIQDKYPRFEFFVNFRHFIEDRNALLRAIFPIITSKWTLYVCDESTFPLCDTSVLRDKNTIFFPLSPKMLLEVDLGKVDHRQLQCNVKYSIGFSKYYDFEKLMIRNFNEYIIFPSFKKLEILRQSQLYKDRVKFLQNE